MKKYTINNNSVPQDGIYKPYCFLMSPEEAEQKNKELEAQGAPGRYVLAELVPYG